MRLYYNRWRFLFILTFVSITLYSIINYISHFFYDPCTAITVGTQGPLFDAKFFHAGSPKPNAQTATLTVVTGHMPSEDISWLTDLSSQHPHISTAIYPISAPNTTLPANKGHEAMVYLTYILDHYPLFPDIILFIHAHQNAWHNNILNDLSTSTTIERLNLNHVLRQGYFNTRCHLDPGCPTWLKVDRPFWGWDWKHRPEEPFLTSDLFHELHGDVDLPVYISQPCCAQFALSGERILGRPKEFYERYREWLLTTALEDDTSGRLMEYSWQYIFTGNWEFCPSQHQCYCEGYGICFEGREEGLKRWLNVLLSKERVDEKMRGLVRKGKGEGKVYRMYMQDSERINGRLTEMRDEAMQRGRDPALRARECGREWRKGDGL